MFRHSTTSRNHRMHPVQMHRLCKRLKNFLSHDEHPPLPPSTGLALKVMRDPIIDQSGDTSFNRRFPGSHLEPGEGQESAGDSGETTRDFGSRGGPEHKFTRSVGRLENPCWLARNAERGENRPVGVSNVGKGQTVARDETINFVLGAVPANPDNLNLSGPLLTGHLDRGGFTVAGASIRRPEPEGNRCPVVSRPKVTRWRHRRSRCR